MVGNGLFLNFSPTAKRQWEGHSLTNSTLLGRIKSWSALVKSPTTFRCRNCKDPLCFSCLFLKRYIDNNSIASGDLIYLWEMGERVLEKIRMVKHSNKAMTQILVKWKGYDTTKATWEDFATIVEKFPNANLGDQVGIWGRSCQDLK